MRLAIAPADPIWQGHIVNTASMAGLLNAADMSVYNASKHAVVALTETLYQDLQLVADRLGASVLCPFFMATGIAQSHRNCPDQPNAAKSTKNQLIGQALIGKAVGSGKVSAAAVAAKVFDAVAANPFYSYSYSHPKAIQSVQTRMDNVLQSRNPTTPFVSRPEICEQLKAALQTP